MRQTRVAKRYAKSLLTLATEKNAVEEIHADMHVISDAIADNRELEVLLKSPVVKSDKKSIILKQIFSSKISKVSSEFLEILVRKKREGIIEVIADEFEELYRRLNKITVAEVRTARTLDEETTSEIMNIVQKMAHDTIELKEIIDPDIIGGFIIKVGDKQVDASVLRKLSDYRKTFSKNPYIANL
ncbi:MAG: ATP synthase F1 subunit delta [Flavobacteriales bacterium]|nr:ATP synthase F1 subunit delta [Flavobacteriales bacterium]